MSDDKVEQPEEALVLLSGGADSVALSHYWSEKHPGSAIHALSCDYSQPHRSQELSAAQSISERNGWAWSSFIAPGIGALNSAPGRDASGVSIASVPGRNGILMWHAANWAGRFLRGRRVTILFGATMDDWAGFPDCRWPWFASMRDPIKSALEGVVDLRIQATWLELGWRKVDILRWASTRPEVMRDIHASVSCYVGKFCGACDACTLRARSFAEVGIADSPASYAVIGGDAARDARFAK